MKNKTKNPDIIILGSGIVGCATAKLARERGFTTMIIDKGEKLSASKCIMDIVKLSWINKSIWNEYIDGKKLLDKYAGVEAIEVVNKGKAGGTIEAFDRYDSRKVLDEVVVFGDIHTVNKKKVVYYDQKEKKIEVEAKKAVFVCLGAWTGDFLSRSGYSETAPQLDNKYGEVFELKEDFKPKDGILNFYDWWLPFKSVVFCTIPSLKTSFFGDAHVVKIIEIKDCERDERVKKARAKLRENLRIYLGKKASKNVISEYQGLRPYLKKSEQGFIRKQDKGLYSAVGTAKNGLILCFHIAKDLLSKIEKGK